MDGKRERPGECVGVAAKGAWHNNKGDCYGWEGVKCDDTTLQVTRLFLNQQMRLELRIPLGCSCLLIPSTRGASSVGFELNDLNDESPSLRHTNTTQNYKGIL